MGIIEVDLPLHLVLDKLRDGKIGLPEVAFHDLFPLFLDGRDMGSYLESVLRADQSDTFREQSHNSLPFMVKPFSKIDSCTDLDQVSRAARTTIGETMPALRRQNEVL
jgi:hypothetical protein